MPKGILTALALSATLLTASAATATASAATATASVAPSASAATTDLGQRNSPYFRSAFNGPDAGWRNVVGNWSVRDGNLQAMGAPDRFSSVKHVGTYDDFEYEVRMNRIGNSDGSAENCLIVRANPGRVVDDLWRPGYYFCYSNNGQALVVAVDSRGNQRYLLPWTPVREIGNGGGYRTLHLVAYHDSFSFSINHTPIFETEDDMSSFGSVGVGFYVEPGKRGTLKIDSAALGPVRPA